MTAAPTAQKSPFMTTEETAELLRTPVGTLYRWRQRGKGPPAVRVGRRLLYRRSDVLAWIEKLEQRQSEGR